MAAAIRLSFVVLFPVSEILYFRTVFHHAFGANCLIFGNYGRDIFVPVICGTALLWFCHVEEVLEIVSVSLWKTALLLNLSAASILLLFTTYHFAIQSLVSDAAFVFVLLSLAGAIYFSGWFVFLPVPARNILYWRGKKIERAVLSFLLLLMYPQAVNLSWRILSQIAAGGAHLLLRLWNVPTTYLVSRDIIIKNAYVALSINQSCSGWEGVFYFLFAFGLCATIVPHQTNYRRYPFFIAMGLALLTFLNILRIALIFYLGLYLRKTWGAQQASQAMSWAFHENVGWLLYLLAIFAMYRLYRAWIIVGSPAPAGLSQIDFH